MIPHHGIEGNLARPSSFREKSLSSAGVSSKSPRKKNAFAPQIQAQVGAPSARMLRSLASQPKLGCDLRCHGELV
jgi:hypothetical protein